MAYSAFATLPSAREKGQSRRTLLKAGAAGLAASTLNMLELLAWTPRRLFDAAPPGLPNIQFDIGDYIAPAQTIDGVTVRFGPVYTAFATARLTPHPGPERPSSARRRLDTIEASYSFSPDGVFTFMATASRTSSAFPLVW